MGISAIKFEHRDGVEWVGWQQPNGDTTSDYVEQVKAGPDWELFRPAYEAWQAELIDTGDERTKKAKKPEPAPKDKDRDAWTQPKQEKPAPKSDEDDEDVDDPLDPGRRTMAKGYRK